MVEGTFHLSTVLSPTGMSTFLFWGSVSIPKSKHCGIKGVLFQESLTLREFYIYCVVLSLQNFSMFVYLLNLLRSTKKGKDSI